MQRSCDNDRLFSPIWNLIDSNLDSRFFAQAGIVFAGVVFENLSVIQPKTSGGETVLSAFDEIV